MYAVRRGVVHIRPEATGFCFSRILFPVPYKASGGCLHLRFAAIFA